MPNPTYVLISSQTLASAAASVTFSSIASTYTDLKFVVSARSAAAGDIDLRLTLNGSGSGYSEKMLYGTGSSAASAGTSGSFWNWSGQENNSSQTANTFSNCEIYIPNYLSSNYKSLSADSVRENNATAADQRLWAGLWSNTSAITSATFTTDSGNFVTNSTFYLYGIKNS